MCVLYSTERISLKKSGANCCAHWFLAFKCKSGLWPSISSDCLGLVCGLKLLYFLLFLGYI